MSLIVAKFGGTSLCDAQMFRTAAKIISEDAGRRYIILSAPGKRSQDDEKVTDLLLRAYNAEPPQDQFIFSQIFQRYTSIRDELCPTFDLEAECMEIFKKLHTSADYAASRGEYLCAKLFAACFDIPFADAENLLFFGSCGTIDQEASFRAIRNTLPKYSRAVIPGFYASSPTGIKTFSRGGSDVSGAWIAAALRADIYENWTDVDGVFSSDPGKIPDTMLHKCISAKQMRQMALSGANVLHPDALAPLAGSGINTVIRNTFRPDVHGTVISSDFEEYVPAVTGTCPVYFDKNGLHSPLAVHSEHMHDKAAGIISVFGANTEAFRAITAKYKSIHIIHMPEHIQIITEIDQYQTTLADIHRILAENIR